ncbi:histone RNA hairpin-binding protein isoform X2 [Hyla sarda]|uniref:histone RNA hairpin-binding protein isoform X2 n=1 Tax=Hyla sarda TaxID=327740 RepID=UPI0024C454DC|nr:histone RNA hairpin-binding protein isoform X2 [Hyla sarda]
MYRHRDSRTDEPRSQPPTRWSQGRKRQSDGNFRRRKDEEETVFNEKSSLSSDRRPDSFTTPESHRPVSRCKDWGSAVEEEENLMETVEKDLARGTDLRNSSNPKETVADPTYYFRVAKKTRQINNIKNTDMYQRYIQAVPRHARQSWHPRTPDRFSRTVTRKIFRARLNEWRIALQEWDLPKDGTDDRQPFSGGKTASKSIPRFIPRIQRRKSRFDQPQKDKDKPTNVKQLEDAADLERKWSSVRELIREHRQKQQTSGASPSRLPPTPHAEQLSVSPAVAKLQLPHAEQHMAGVPGTEVLRLIQSIDAHNDQFDHFGKSIAARCRILPSKVRSELQAVIEGAVAAYELADPAQLPASAYVVDLIRNLCGISPSLPTVSLAPQLPHGATATQTSLLSVFNSVTLSSLPSQPPSLRPAPQPVPPAPHHYPQHTPSAPHHYTQPSSSAYNHPTPRYYNQPAPSSSVPPPNAAYYSAPYKPPFK